MHPIVTLTTDFGTEDSYVAQMKGVLLSRGPADLRVVDLSHTMPAHDVAAAARFLRAAVPRFPPGTVHVGVVDPGVGSARQALVVQVADQWLVGPDNGLWSHLFDGQERVFAIDPMAGISTTFHGRDVFAPAAARLATGAAPATWAHPTAHYVRLEGPECVVGPHFVEAKVWHVDRFGNILTTVDGKSLTDFLRGRTPSGLRVELDGGRQPKSCVDGLHGHYAEVPPGSLLALMGSDDRLEVALREGHAARHLAIQVGDPVTVRYETP